MGIGLDISWQGMWHDRFTIVAELEPFFEIAPVIGRAIGDLVEPGVFTSPAGIASETYEYRVNGVVRPPSYVLAPADNGQMLRGIATITDKAGTESVFYLPPETIIYAAPVIVGSGVPQNLTQGTGIHTYDVAPLIVGDAVTVSLVSPPSGISVTGTVISIDTDATGVLSAQTVTVQIINSGGSATIALEVNVAAGVAAPDAFAVDVWSLAVVPAGGGLSVTIGALPYNGGSAITGVEYRVDGGEWVDAGLTTLGLFQITGLTNGQPFDVSLRAANSAGSGSPSDIKTETPDDTVAPIISAPSIDTIARTISLTASEGGFLLWSRNTTPSYPDGATMAETMAASKDGGSITIAVDGGPYPLTLAPNAAGQDYLHIVERDTAGNYSDVKSTLVEFPEVPG